MTIPPFPHTRAAGLLGDQHLAHAHGCQTERVCLPPCVGAAQADIIRAYSQYGFRYNNSQSCLRYKPGDDITVRRPAGS